ncbi:hypothetical protein ACQ4PT_019787 [Festuca glaucescens]
MFHVSSDCVDCQDIPLAYTLLKQFKLVSTTILATSVQFFSKRRFCFERVWLRMPGFMDVVRDLWNAVPAHGDALQRLDMKLRSLARGLQSWSQRKVGSIRDQLRAANELILQLDKAQDVRELTVIETWLRRSVKARVLGLACLDRTTSRQRACVSGLSTRDANAQFYCILASSRRRRSHIVSLRHSDVVASEQVDKEELATSFFTDLLGRAVARDHDISLAAVGLPAVDLSGLEVAFSVEEAWTAIKDMPANHAPGRDGFSWDFYQHCWPIIKHDVVAALRDVYLGHGQHFGAVNSALITLIPKKDGAVELKDFCPISLVHSFAKLLAKILALRLAPRLPELVDTNQSAFVRGLCIHDNFMLVEQSAQTLHRSKVSSLLLKLDVAHAFDSAGVRIEVGAGDRVLFWVEPWIRGLSFAALAPVLLKLVRPGTAHSCSVRQGLQANAWVEDIVGTLTVDAVVQFLHVCPLVQSVQLDPKDPDSFTWKFSASGRFDTKSAYLACFAGRTSLPAAKEVWASFVSLKHKFFGWLAIQSRCWTADRLERRGLPNHGLCPFCQSASEDIDHLLLQCHYSRAIWFNLLWPCGFLQLLPSPTDRIKDWWPRSSMTIAASSRRTFNSLCLLVMRAIWLERNAHVFEDTACLASSLSDRVSVEWREWVLCRGTSRTSGRISGGLTGE